MLRTVMIALALLLFACAADRQPDPKPLSDEEMAEIGDRADQEIQELDASPEIDR